MSYADPEPLPRRLKVAAAVSVLLMVPVMLDVAKVIDLGEFRMAPFFILLAGNAFAWAPRNAGA
ncbi:MAG: hypothetical protein RLZZ407_2022 [Pseudomonadota bacterium]|jgi:hypothetical protein